MKNLSLILLLVLAGCLFGCKTVEEEKEAAPAEVAEKTEVVEAAAPEAPKPPSVRHENGQLVIDMVEVQ